MTNTRNDTAEVQEASANQSDEAPELGRNLGAVEAAYVLTERDLRLRQSLGQMLTATGGPT